MIKNVILFSVLFGCAQPISIVDSITIEDMNDAPITTIDTSPAAQIDAPEISDFPDSFPLSNVEDKVLHVWTDDPETLVLLNEAIETLTTLGINIELNKDDGVQFIRTTKDIGGQARAMSTSWCYYNTCNKDNVHVWVSDSLFDFSIDFQHNAIQHELGHIINGWGRCVKSSKDLRVQNLPIADRAHLTHGHLISNGNGDYGSLTWSNDDIVFLHSCELP